MIRLLMVLIGLSGPATAETARVLSGEHGDFTRLVIERPQASDWVLGRTPSGYAFGFGGSEQPDYDLSSVWQRIGRSRLKSLQIEEGSGALQLDLACDCHIFPFEYRPGVVVLDIKPGPPPLASVFEAAFAPATARDLPAAPDTSGPRYDWLSSARKAANTSSSELTLPMPLDTGDVSLDPLREELLEQISRGAAEGVVEMELPGKPKEVEAVDHGELPWSQIRIGEQPGMDVSGLRDPQAGLEQPSECPDESLLDIVSWAEERPALELLVAARAGLYGEFDIPDPDAVLRSVRLHLYLGFGAEAVQQTALIDDSSDLPELALYRSMGKIIDSESDPDSPFGTMLACDNAAALWAAIARDALPVGPEMDRDAVLRAFVALPPHLRRHLAVGLAEKFLAIGDEDGARIIRDTLDRTPHADPAEVELLDAKTSLHNDDIDAAQDHADAAVTLDGDSAENLVALVEAHFRKLEPIAPDIAEALQAHRGESDGTSLGDAIDRAFVLALALSDQTDAAFSDESATGPVLADLWGIVQSRATDDAFLEHAVLSEDDARPGVAPEIELAVARRLLALGFADAALVWLGPVAPEAATERRLAAAEAELGRGDARAAIRYLAGLEDREAESARAKALVQLGDLDEAADALIVAGDEDGAKRLALWDGDWAEASPETQAPWLTAAGHLVPTGGKEDQGLLARGGATVAESLAAREAVEALLAAVPRPTDG